MRSRKVGFIGLGEMGKGMASNLARGFDLTVFDILPEPVEELKKLGARAARSPAALAETCDYVITMARNTAQTNDIIFGKDGLWGELKDGSVLLITSTIDPQFVREVSKKAAPKGIKVLDAPVSGGARGAKGGTLTIMVGGEETTFKECQPLFEAIGKSLFYIGGIGCGLAAKLANNAVWYMNRFALKEGLRLGSEAGVDSDKLLEMIKVSSGGSTVASAWEILRNNPMKNIDKDISLALDLAKSTGVKLPVLGLTSQLPVREQ
ncbi:MAG: NAD(P)-dependent oxidoreductase [Dehalococcoidia bacterium]|nr:NAD(P)-dependent oxidoreductase [Dehalococcoidia bacterium]